MSRAPVPQIDTPKSVLGREAPVVPQTAAGITDSRFFRRHGIPAYGVSPFVLDAELMRTVHARDKRIPLAELERGAARMSELAATWARGGSDDHNAPAREPDV